jgi:hypothetical protein
VLAVSQRGSSLLFGPGLAAGVSLERRERWLPLGGLPCGTEGLGWLRLRWPATPVVRPIVQDSLLQRASEREPFRRVVEHSERGLRLREQQVGGGGSLRRQRAKRGPRRQARLAGTPRSHGRRRESSFTMPYDPTTVWTLANSSGELEARGRCCFGG